MRRRRARPLCLSVCAPPPLLPFSHPTLLLSLEMDELLRLGIFGNMSRSKGLFALGPLSYQALLDLRLALYHEAVGLQLVDGSMSLVRVRPLYLLTSFTLNISVTVTSTSILITYPVCLKEIAITCFA